MTQDQIEKMKRDGWQVISISLAQKLQWIPKYTIHWRPQSEIEYALIKEVM